MNVVMFAYTVDRLLQQQGFVRSKLSVIQKAVSDQLIRDHFAAKSSPQEASKIVRDSLVSLHRQEG